MALFARLLRNFVFDTAAPRVRWSRCVSRNTSTFNVCVVGSGPAGFYTAYKLLKDNPDVKVDIYEKLPVPFGLVRYGVAPDHPDVKNVINQFTELAHSGRCTFVGNISIGTQLTVDDLKHYYNAIVMAYGAKEERKLGIPGEDLPGVYSARAFVGWYNGLPEEKNLHPDLSGERAVIFGQGNVAVDVARILLTPVELLKNTDICAHALNTLAQSKIRRVDIVGRRGPLQVAFTIKELRELTKLPGCFPSLDPSDFDGIQPKLSEVPRPRKRITELMINAANKEIINTEGLKEWTLTFLRSPVELLSSTDGTVSSVKLEKNRIEDRNGVPCAIGTGEMETRDCDVVFCSIGYKGVPVDNSVPFDSDKGIIPNKDGRVLNNEGEHIPGLYCSGWVKRGPTGVIVNTMNDAFATAHLILMDFNDGKLPVAEYSGEATKKLLPSIKGLDPITFSQWEKIDHLEQQRGNELGKPREKVISVEEMVTVATTE
ncbi:NADPH:adrenodoxin oxidoreductase, mitochondrial-like isoform X2 [Dysidea avara]|uniref:NADPH:adrenodoxin oxidoreductase, mitochondrial-like isoform X2 n=1 Tax=Dysidea avara TaxID=196820 RepID=UPI0033307093